MKKRIFAFLGCLVVLVAALAVPAFAETDSSNTVVITSSASLAQGDGSGTTYFSAYGTLIVAGAVNSNQDGTYTGDIYVKDYGGEWELYVEDADSYDRIFFMLESYGTEFQDGQTVLTFQYLTENIDRFNYPEATNAGFTLNGIGGGTGGGFTQEDLDNARQEGYEQGLEDSYSQVVPSSTTVWHYATLSVSYVYTINGNEISGTYEDFDFDFAIGESVRFPGWYYVDVSGVRWKLINALVNTGHPDVTSDNLTNISLIFSWPSDFRWKYYDVVGDYVGLAMTEQYSYVTSSGSLTIGNNLPFIDDFNVGVSAWTLDNGLYALAPEGVYESGPDPLPFNYTVYSFTIQYGDNTGEGSLELDPMLKAVYFSSDYYAGYGAGLKVGASEATSDQLESYYTNGYHQGYIVGKEEGIRVSDQGTFANLFTSVLSAPVAAFNGLFDFEILGLDMKAFMGSLITLCLLLIVIRLVVL